QYPVQKNGPGGGQSPGPDQRTVRRCGSLRAPFGGSGVLLLTSGQQAAVTQAAHFPPRDAIARQQRRQHQIDHVRLCRPEAAWSGDDRNFILISQKEYFPWPNWAQKAPLVTADPHHAAPDYIFRPSRRGG